ncbi:uncharacterized protein LOC143228645 isoform X1 [Tachypleus tridentatus]|uniref:uncharacterized protein LOC143228645 isoform X1 n=1 Tax=Tachypleus tridentatus TaxID=6853 RepID=UPI003FD470DC
MFQDIQNNVSQNEFGQQFKVEKTKLDHSSEVKSQSNSLSAEEKYKSSPRVTQHRIGSITSIINGQSNVNNGELFDVTPTGSLRRRRNYLSSEDQNDELIDYLKHTSDLQDKNCKFVRNVDGGSLDRSLLRIPGRRRRRKLLAVDFNERERSTSLISQTMERTMDVSEDITEVKPKQWTRKTEDWLQVNEKEEKSVMKLDDQMLFESDKQQKQEERELDTLFYDLRKTDEGSRSSSLGTLLEAKTDSEIYTRKLKNAMPNTDTERVMETVEGVQAKNKSRWRKNNMKVAYSCESVDDDHHGCHNQKSMNSLNGFKSSLRKDNSWDNDTLTLYVRKSSADSKLSKSIITSFHSNLGATMDSKLEISTQPNTSTVFDRNKEINSSNITKKDSEAVKCGSATEWSSEIQNLAPNGQTQQKVANGEAVSLPKPYIQYNITSSKQFIKPSSFTNLEFGNEKSLTSPNVIPPVSKIPVPPQKTRLYKSMMESFIRSTPFEGVKSVEDFEIIYNSKHYLTVQEGSLFKKQASADVKSTVGKQAKAAQRSQFLESNHEQTVENRGSLPQDELDGLKGEGSFDRFSLIRKTTRRTRPNQEKNGNEKVKQSTRCYDPGKGLQLVTSQCNDKVKQSTRCYDPGKGLQLVTSQCNEKVKKSTRCYDPGKGLQLVTSQCNEKVKKSTRCYDPGKGLQLVTSQCYDKIKQSTRCYDPGKGLQLVTSQCNDKVKQSTRCYDPGKGLQLVTSQCNDKVKQSTRCYDPGKGLQLVTSQCNDKVKQSTRCYDPGKGLQLVTSQCNDKVKQSTRCYDPGKGLQLVTSQCNDKVKQSTRCYDPGKGLQLVTSQCNEKVKQSTRCYDPGKGLQLVTSQCNEKVKQSTRCYDPGKGLQLVTSQCNEKVKKSTRCYDPGKGLQLVTSQCNEKVKKSTRCYDPGKGLQLVTSQCYDKIKQSTRCYDPGKGLQLVTSQCNEKVKQSTRCYDPGKGLQLVTSQCNDKVKQSTRCYDPGKGLQLVTSQCNEKVKQSTRCYDPGKGLQLVTSQCNEKVKKSTRCYDPGKGLQLVTSQCNEKVKKSTRCYDPGKGLQLVTSQCYDKIKQSTRCYDPGKGLQLVTSQCNDKVKQSTRCYDPGKGLQLVTSQCNDKVKQSTRCYDSGKGLQLVTSQCNEKDFIKREMKDTGVARLEIQQLNHFSNLKPKPCNIEELDNKSRENNYRTPIKDEPLDSKRKSISLRARLAKRWSSLTENFKKNPETGEQHSLPGDMLSGLTYSLSEETSTGKPNNINPNSFLVSPSENLDNIQGNKSQVDVHPHSNVIEIQTSVNKSADNALQSKTEYLLSDEKCSSEKPLLVQVSFYSKRDHSALNSSQMFKKKNLEEHDHDEGFEETQSLMSETLSQDTSSPDTDSPRNLRQIVPHGLLEKPRNTCTQLEYKTLPNESTQQSLIGTPNNMGERKSHIGKHVESVKITSKTFQQSKNSRTKTESSLDEKEILLSARSSTRSYLTRIQRTANHSPTVSERKPPVQFQESNCKNNSRTGLRSSKNNFVVESTLLKTRTRNQEGSKRNFMRENTAITLTTTNMMKNLAKVRGVSDNYNISQSTPATPNIENKQLLGISSRELWSSGKTQSNSSVNRSNSQYSECSLSRRSLTLTRVTLKAASQKNNQSSYNKQLLNSTSSTSKEMNVCHSADVKNVVHQNDSVMKQNPFITRNGVVSGKHPTTTSTQKGKQLSFMKATSLSSAKGKSGLTQKPEPEVQRVHIKASRISPSRTRMVTSTHRKQMK